MVKYIFILFLFLSCQKQQQQVKRVGGLLEDKPNNVPVLVSKGFISPSTQYSIAAKGKPVRPDVTAPVVYFTSPSNGTSVTGTVSISITATDKGGIASSYILINGARVASGYGYTWNTTGLPSGLYTLSAMVTDLAGNTAVASITVTINTIIIEPPVDTVITTAQIAMPPVGNQGGEGSCVAFAVGYAARSVDWYYRTTATSYSYSTNIFSPEFLYNQIKFSSDCGIGSAMQPALEFMMTNGIPTFNSMPYTDAGCALLPNASQSAEALNYKINGYHKIYTTDRVAIKSMIDQKKPVIISIMADNSFMQAQAGFIWRTYSGSGSLGHCIVICGYDDTKNAWLIMNSWGTGWGDAGYLWMDYDLFPTRTGTWCYAIN